jgi:hypothetical protein
MLYVSSPRRRSWVSIGWIMAIVFSVVGAVFNIYAGALLMLIVTTAGATLALAGRVSRPRSASRERVAAGTAWSPSPRRTIYTTDGTAREAFVVPVQGIAGYQTVMTADGYVLVNDESQVVYTLRQQ